MSSHDELGCITDACAMYQAVYDEADRMAEQPAFPFGKAGCGSTPVVSDLSAEDELRTMMPLLLAELSPAARALLVDHLDHVRELVAHVWRMEATYG